MSVLEPNPSFDAPSNYQPKNSKTYELSIQSSQIQTHEQVKAWLLTHNITAFVEAAVDGIDLDPDFDPNDAENMMNLHLGDTNSLIVYSYSVGELTHLQKLLEDAFGKDVEVTMGDMQTRTWQEGWKESFKPIKTQKFYIYPPWESIENLDNKLIPIEIEPGMAFGTGQHATTKLCLEFIEKLASQGESFINCLDAGTGSGILAIAAEKINLVTNQIVATDIDIDAIDATISNIKTNNCHKISAIRGSIVPAESGYELIVANILCTTIIQLLDKLTEQLAPDGVLLLSGILAEEQQRICDAAASYQLEEVDFKLKDDWYAGVFKRK